MNKRIIAVIAIIFTILFSVTLTLYENQGFNKRYIEHEHKKIQYPNYDYSGIDYNTYKSQDITLENINSHLPILSFNTFGQSLHGAAKSDNELILSELRVYEDGNYQNLTYQTGANIRWRGNSSRRFDKKNIKIELVDDDLLEADYPLLGLSSDHDYALHGPYMDKSLIRNYLGYNLTGQIMDYSPNVRYCEVFINNQYQGLYLLVESVKLSEDKVNISPIDKHSKSNTTSYIFEKEDAYDFKKNRVYLDTFVSYTKKMDNIVRYRIEYPNKELLAQERYDYINKDVNDFERKLYSIGFNDDLNGYATELDIDAFVDYFVINEFFINYDAGNLSTYIYKDKRGKYNIVFWDMNNIFDNYLKGFLEKQDFIMKDKPWFEMLLKDKEFTNKAIKRYKILRQTVLSEEYLYQFIDDTVDYLGPAIERNFVRWGNSFSDEKNLFHDEARNTHSYEETIAQLKNAIHVRGEFLDQNIESLRQFSQDAKVKSLKS